MGSSKKVTVGYHYHVASHAGLTKGPIDAFLEFRGGDKPAWNGVLQSSGTIQINQPNLWGGEKDQGGIVGPVDVMFGEADQQPNSYLLQTFGSQIPAWRGFATVVFRGGRYGAMNPYPQKASYKIRRILKGWDNDECWYPEKAEITMLPQQPLAIYFAIDLSGSMNTMTDNGQTRLTNMKTALNACLDMIKASVVDGGALVDIMIVGWGDAPDGRQSIIRRGINGAAGINALKSWISGRSAAYGTYFPAGLMDLSGFIASSPTDYNKLAFFITDGEPAAPGYTADQIASAAATMVWSGPWVPIYGINIDLADTKYTSMVDTTDSDQVPVVRGGDPTALTNAIMGALGGVKGMNPAHILYYSRTNSEMGREPVENMNDASLRAAADWYYEQGFGLCVQRDPGQESPRDFEIRICRVAGCAFTRSTSDGQWYIDIANGEYNLEDLPILTDDDILEFREAPSILDNAVNAVGVRYFDPINKEDVETGALRALGLISSFGTIHQTNEYPEIPTAGLALRVAMRDLRTTATPTKTFDLVATRKPYAWRRNQYFRLQAPKRGIADMVCIVGEIKTGSLRSGAITLKAVQDVYSLPESVYVEPEPGVDTRPSQTALRIEHQRAFEAPYIDVVTSLSRADLDVLPDDVGFLVGVAADPAESRDFTMRVALDGDVVYGDVANGDWCPTAVIVEAADYLDTDFTFTNGTDLNQVEIGMPVLWDDEICRLDALDIAAGTVALGRGCADTVPAKHAAGSRLWFYEAGAASDPTEYTGGETLNVKLLTNTGSHQLPEGAAMPVPVTFNQRQVRPYPPGNLRVNGLPYPLVIEDPSVTIEWSHRDRLLIADQLIDAIEGDIGPEPGTTYEIEIDAYDSSMNLIEAGWFEVSVGTATTYTIDFTATTPPEGVTILDIHIRSVRDGLDSLQFVSVRVHLLLAPSFSLARYKSLTSPVGLRALNIF